MNKKLVIDQDCPACNAEAGEPCLPGCTCSGCDGDPEEPGSPEEA